MIWKVLLEGVGLGVLLVLVCLFGIRKGAVVMVHLYSPEVQKRCVEHGLTTYERIRRNQMLFKVCCIPGYIAYVLVFVYAVPVSLVTLLVLNSVWNGGRRNRYIISALVVSIITTVYLTFLRRNLWQLWLLAIPALLLVFLGARIYHSAQKH